MKSPFPQTPTMEYERMLAAATVALFAFVLATQCVDMLIKTVDTVPALGGPGFTHEMLRVVAFGGASCGFTLLGMAFALFASTKAHFRRRAQYLPMLRRIRGTGIRLVKLAFVCAILWLAASIALATWSGT